MFCWNFKGSHCKKGSDTASWAVYYINSDLAAQTDIVHTLSYPCFTFDQFTCCRPADYLSTMTSVIAAVIYKIADNILTLITGIVFILLFRHAAVWYSSILHVSFYSSFSLSLLLSTCILSGGLSLQTHSLPWPVSFCFSLVSKVFAIEFFMHNSRRKCNGKYAGMYKER